MRASEAGGRNARRPAAPRWPHPFCFVLGPLRSLPAPEDPGRRAVTHCVLGGRTGGRLSMCVRTRSCAGLGPPGV